MHLISFEKFFPNRPSATPTIYACTSTHPNHTGLLKVRYSNRDAAAWVAAQFPRGLFKRADMARKLDIQGALA